MGSPGITKIQTNGRIFLQIGAHSQPSSKASWRATYLLEPGRYRFNGDVLLEKHGSDDANRVAALRASEAAKAAITYPSATWTNLICEFTVTAKRYVDLICEYQADGGLAWFDSGSLTLTHLGDDK